MQYKLRNIIHISYFSAINNNLLCIFIVWRPQVIIICYVLVNANQ